MAFLYIENYRLFTFPEPEMYLHLFCNVMAYSPSVVALLVSTHALTAPHSNPIKKNENNV